MGAEGEAGGQEGLSGLVLAVDESYEESHWLPLALGHTLRMVLFLWPTTRHPFSALRISRKTLAPGAIAGCSMRCPVLLVPLLLSSLVAGAALLSAHLNENSRSLSSGAAIGRPRHPCMHKPEAKT